MFADQVLIYLLKLSFEPRFVDGGCDKGSRRWEMPSMNMKLELSFELELEQTTPTRPTPRLRLVHFFFFLNIKYHAADHLQVLKRTRAQ